MITQHEIQVGGRKLRYTAEAGRVAIRDVETGEPHGYIFYVAYRVPSPARARPVTFVWNGGPGASSATLHFEVAGPKRAESGRLVDNDDTWLTDTDLVFVDPVGTGFSRPARSEYAAEFYSTVGDINSITEFVRAWRLLHDAEESPVFLAGESWGAGRAASVGYALLKRGVRVDGLALISGGAGLRPPADAEQLIDALRIVNLAATGLYHGRTAPELGRDPDAIRRTAERWVRETYVPALERVSELSETERARIAAELSRFTGLSADQIDRSSLVISPRQYRTGLLKDRNETLSVFDMRLTDKGEPEADPVTQARQAILKYLRRDLGYRTDLPYIGLEEITQGYAPSGKYPEPVNARWNYATGPVTPEAVAAAVAEAARTGSGPPRLGPPLPGTAEAVALNPRLKVLVAAGLHDSYASCAGNEELARRLPPELGEAIRFRCYVGGHMMYRDASTRVQFSRDIRELVRP